MLLSKKEVCAFTSYSSEHIRRPRHAFAGQFPAPIELNTADGIGWTRQAARDRGRQRWVAAKESLAAMPGSRTRASARFPCALPPLRIGDEERGSPLSSPAARTGGTGDGDLDKTQGNVGLCHFPASPATPPEFPSMGQLDLAVQRRAEATLHAISAAIARNDKRDPPAVARQALRARWRQ